jgi:hypothetical protein
VQDIVTTTGAGIAVAAISGITIIAYKHPQAFRKLFWFLISLLVLSYVIMFSWTLSNNYAADAAFDAASHIKSISFSEMENIRDAVHAWNIPVWCLHVINALFLYLGFLRSFPAWLLDKKPPDDEKQRPRSS